MVLKFVDCNDRDRAATLLRSEIAVRRSQLPPPEPGEYYWADLEGLRVVTLGGIDLGTVAAVFATGANDVLVVRGNGNDCCPSCEVKWWSKSTSNGACCGWIGIWILSPSPSTPLPLWER